MTKEEREVIRAQYEDTAVIYQNAFNKGEKEANSAIKALAETTAYIPELLDALDETEGRFERERETALGYQTRLQELEADNKGIFAESQKNAERAKTYKHERNNAWDWQERETQRTNEIEAQRDRLAARCEALERAILDSFDVDIHTVCYTCTHYIDASGFCDEVCTGNHDAWQFDEARFAVNEKVDG